MWVQMFVAWGSIAAVPATRTAALEAQPARAADKVALLRKAVAKTALEQLKAVDPAWNPAERDCAGLIRFAYRAAHRAMAPDRLARPLWRDGAGEPTAFADAATLIEANFQPIGRGPETRRILKDGDIAAFRQDPGDGQEPVYHLMLVVRAERLSVVYHPGSASEAVRSGAIDDLEKSAPIEWRPVPENSAFLGFYRFKEWLP